MITGTERSSTKIKAKRLSNTKGGNDCKVKTNFAGTSMFNIPTISLLFEFD